MSRKCALVTCQQIRDVSDVQVFIISVAMGSLSYYIRCSVSTTELLHAHCDYCSWWHEVVVHITESHCVEMQNLLTFLEEFMPSASCYVFQSFGAGIKFVDLRGWWGNMLADKVWYTLDQRKLHVSETSADGCTRMCHNWHILWFSDNCAVWWL